MANPSSEDVRGRGGCTSGAVLGMMLGSILGFVVAMATNTPPYGTKPAAGPGFGTGFPYLVGILGGGFVGLLLGACVGGLLGARTVRKARREQTRCEAAETLRKFEQRHGDKPVEEWPELDRQTYTNAKRILAETDGKP